MKIYEFEGNTLSCSFEYHRTKEGPNRFITYYKNSSRLFYDIGEGWKDAWRVMGVSKFTTTAQAIKAWCLSMHEQFGDQPKEAQGHVDTSFASEVQSESDPTTDTKMIT